MLAELTRKITVLRVNEKSLTRRYTLLQDTEKAVRKENTKLHNGMMELEAAVTKKIGDLQRHKVSLDHDHYGMINFSWWTFEAICGSLRKSDWNFHL